MAKWNNTIGIPFAENGDRSAIPDTSESGDVNNTTGFGNKYEVDPAVGGLWLYRQTMNSLFYNLFNSIKEIQTKVPISVNGSSPDASGNISIPIPTADGAGIKVIDDNTPDITSFNQITEDGIYYIYKQLSDGPSIYETYNLSCYKLIVLNIKQEESNLNICMQLISINVDGFTLIPGNIGVIPMSRVYNKNDSEWFEWYDRIGIAFIDNNIMIREFAVANKLNIRFPIISDDNSFSGYNTFMYSATKEQMREQLGISDSNIEKWSTYTHSIYTIPEYSNNYKNISYCLFTKNINNIDYNMIKIQCLLSYSSKSVTTYLNFRIPLPENINIYIDGTDLQNNVVAYIKCYCQNTSTEYDTAEKKVFLNGSMLGGIEKVGSDNYIIISASTASSVQANDPSIFLVEIEAFVDDASYAPTPTAINVTKIMQDQITLTYTRGQ